MKIVAFAASSSSKSINKQLVQYAASQIKGAEVDLLDLNDYELPLFSEDKEQELGQPQLAHDFLAKLATADLIMISFAEHNGSYSAAYKNLFDWCSRIKKPFQHKPMMMLATSPGKGGGRNVLKQAVESASHFDGEVKGSFSLPSFNDNFDVEQGCIINLERNAALLDQLRQFNLREYQAKKAQ